jgi:hypothetical protein
MNNLPQSEIEMALVALLNAVRDYRNAVEATGRELNETVKLLTTLAPMLEAEMSQDSDRSVRDYQEPKGQEENNHEI